MTSRRPAASVHEAMTPTVHPVPLADQVEQLTIVLQVDGTAGWTRDADAPRTQGGVQMRFVGRHTSQTSTALPPDIRGGAFTRLRPVTDDLPPDEYHCPGMNDALDDLRRRLAGEGWIENGRRGHPWSYRYHRQLPD